MIRPSTLTLIIYTVLLLFPAAAQAGNCGCAKLTNSGLPALHQAAADGNLVSLKTLLNRSDPDERFNDNSPLHYAAWHGQIEVARALLDRGAAVAPRGRDGLTPLHFAAWGRSGDVANLLIARGASVSAVSQEGITPLHYAVQNHSLKIAKALLEKGASASPDIPGNETLLHYAVRDEGTDLMELLIEHGSPIDGVNEYGETPLHLAARSEDLSKVKRLLDLHARAGTFPATIPNFFAFSRMVIAFLLLFSVNFAMLAILETPLTGSTTGIFNSNSRKISL